MEAIANESNKKLPITRILVLAFGAMAIAGIVGGFFYLDYYAGSESSTFFPNGMVLSVTARGFSSGGTSVGSIQGEEVPLTFLVRIEDYEFKVTQADVVLCEKQVAQIPAGTKNVAIVSYKSTTTIEADGKTIATIQSGDFPPAGT